MKRASKATNDPRAATMWAVVEAVLPRTARALLYGPPGTGKTTAAVRARAHRQAFVYSLTLTPEMPAAELRGHWIPAGRKFRWHDGPVIRAWREGAPLVVNEIDQAGGDVLSFLRVALDDPEVAVLDLPSGERVRPASGFSVVATMNGDPAVDLPGPLRDRFPVAIHVDEVHPEALARLPEDLRRLAAATTIAPDEERRVSVRVWLEFARLRDEMDEAIAARACFGPRAEQLLADLAVAGGGPRAAHGR